MAISIVSSKGDKFQRPVVESVEDVPAALNWLRDNGINTQLSPEKYILSAINAGLSRSANPNTGGSATDPVTVALNKAIHALNGTGSLDKKRERIAELAASVDMDPNEFKAAVLEESQKRAAEMNEL